MKIYDCFTIWNELDLLEARLEYLYPYVDKFVIVESNTCHNGDKKPFFFEASKEKFLKYWNKIIYVQDTDAPSTAGNTWAIENHHRNCLSRGIINAEPDDVILISDLDEIPHPQNFPFLKSDKFLEGYAYAFVQLHYNYFVNIYSHLNPCVGTVAVKKSTLKHLDPQYMRNNKDKLPRLNFGGWHLSYLGGVERIWSKFMTSCDVQDKGEIPPPEELKEILRQRLKQGQFNLRHFNTDHPVSYIENPFLPSSITKEKYPQFFLNGIDSIV